MTTDPTEQFPARDRLFALIASIPGSGTVDWCGPARALLDEIAATPAYHCPHAAHTLRWGLHPDSTTQGWILRHHDTVIAVLDGYPLGQPPVTAAPALEWADSQLGGVQGWVEQPVGSGAFHAHGETDAVPPVAAPPTGQTGLRELIRRAVCEAEGFAWDSDMLEPDEYGDHADMVLAALFGPIPAGTDTATWTAIRAIQLMNEAGRRRDAVLPPAADRAAVLLWAADALEDRGAVEATVTKDAVWAEAAALLRRLADEAEYVATPCGIGGCEPGGEPCSVHERLMAHAEGDHELCKPDCGPGRGGGEEQQAETQAHPAEHTWTAELRDPLAEEWAPGTRYVVRERAVDALAHARRLAPTWTDGTPTDRRLVRATTTYTVEDEAPPAVVAEPGKENGPRRCAHTDIVYGPCIRRSPHDGECFHQHQPIRIDEETDEDSLCGDERPGDDNFVGQLCGLPGGHFGDHRCDEEIAGTGHTALLRWRNTEEASRG